MREMWELPGRSLKQNAARGAVVIGLVWAFVALPLTLWLGLREPEPKPPAPQRELSVMEFAAVSAARNALGAGFVRVDSQVNTSVARFEVSETIQAATGDSIGKVKSGVESADLHVSSGTVFLRGGSAFWSTIGVPTAFDGWVNVGKAFGDIAFPLRDAAAALAPSAQSRVDSVESGPSQTIYRTEKAAATFTSLGASSLTFNGRTAKIQVGGQDSSGALSAAHSEAAGAGKLTGTSGALTVSEPGPPPAPKP